MLEDRNIERGEEYEGAVERLKRFLTNDMESAGMRSDVNGYLPDGCSSEISSTLLHPMPLLARTHPFPPPHPSLPPESNPHDVTMTSSAAYSSACYGVTDIIASGRAFKETKVETYGCYEGMDGSVNQSINDMSYGYVSSDRGGNRLYHCRQCKEGFDSKSSLQRHAREAHRCDDKSHRCLRCMKTFPTSQQLAQHSLVHSNMRRYPCAFCDKAFKQLSHVQQHQRIHTGDRPYCCVVDGCTKAFRQLSSLQQHLKGHNLPASRTMRSRSVAERSRAVKHNIRRPATADKVGDIISADNSSDQSLRLLARPTDFNCQVCECKCEDETAFFTHIHAEHPDFWGVFSGGRPLSEFIHPYISPPSCAGSPPEIRPEAGGSSSPSCRFAEADSQLKQRREKRFICGVCGKRYLHETGYLKHMSFHRASARGWASPATRKTRVSAPVPNLCQMYNCTICNKSFTKEAYLIRHMEMRPDVAHAALMEKLRGRLSSYRPYLERMSHRAGVIKTENVNDRLPNSSDPIPYSRHIRDPSGASDYKTNVESYHHSPDAGKELNYDPSVSSYAVRPLLETSSNTCIPTTKYSPHINPANSLFQPFSTSIYGNKYPSKPDTESYFDRFSYDKSHLTKYFNPGFGIDYGMWSNYNKRSSSAECDQEGTRLGSGRNMSYVDFRPELSFPSAGSFFPSFCPPTVGAAQARNEIPTCNSMFIEYSSTTSSTSSSGVVREPTKRLEVTEGMDDPSNCATYRNIANITPDPQTNASILAQNNEDSQRYFQSGYLPPLFTSSQPLRSPDRNGSVFTANHDHGNELESYQSSGLIGGGCGRVMEGQEDGYFNGQTGENMDHEFNEFAEALEGF